MMRPRSTRGLSRQEKKKSYTYSYAIFITGYQL